MKFDESKRKFILHLPKGLAVAVAVLQTQVGFLFKSSDDHEARVRKIESPESDHERRIRELEAYVNTSSGIILNVKQRMDQVYPHIN